MMFAFLFKKSSLTRRRHSNEDLGRSNINVKACHVSTTYKTLTKAIDVKRQVMTW